MRDSKRRQCFLQVRLLERIRILLGNDGLAILRRNLIHDLPAITSLLHIAAVMLNVDDGNTFSSGTFCQGRNSTYNLIPLPGLGNDIILNINHHQDRFISLSNCCHSVLPVSVRIEHACYAPHV